MQKKETGWIVALLLLVGIYFYFYTHRGGKKEIQIAVTVRPIPRRSPSDTPFRILFELDSPCKLTSVKVQDTNAVPHIFWHLVAKGASPPVQLFQYGQIIAGMEPDLQGVETDALQPGETYLVEVLAGKIKGVRPFVIPGGSP
jgi:hypothetical protein